MYTILNGSWIKIHIPRGTSEAMRIDPDSWEVLETYDSRKNTVQKVKYGDELFIVKRFNPDLVSGLAVEREILRNCEEMGIAVPELIDSTDDLLILEYIPGDDCKTLFDRGDVDVLRSIAGWLADFHGAFDDSRRRGDCILANFIMHDSRIYGIDLEESSQGNYLRDVGDMCTSILRMKPAFTDQRFSQMRSFVAWYFDFASKEPVDIADSVVEAMDHYSRYGGQREELKRWSEKIKEVGLEDISPR